MSQLRNAERDSYYCGCIRKMFVRFRRNETNIAMTQRGKSSMIVKNIRNHLCYLIHGMQYFLYFFTQSLNRSKSFIIS